MEPAASLPIAAFTSFIYTNAASPPLDPPELLSEFNGLIEFPNILLFDSIAKSIYGTLPLVNIIAPSDYKYSIN